MQYRLHAILEERRELRELVPQEGDEVVYVSRSKLIVGSIRQFFENVNYVLFSRDGTE